MNPVDQLHYSIMRRALLLIARNEANAGLEARAAIRLIGEDWRDGKAEPSKTITTYGDDGMVVREETLE